MLTPKTKKLLVFLNQFIQSNGFAPSFEEIRVGLGLESKSGIHRQLHILSERGFIRIIPMRARAIEVLKMPPGHEAVEYEFCGLKIMEDANIPEGEIWVRDAKGLRRLMKTA